MNWGPNRYLCDVFHEMREVVKKVSIWNLFRYKKIMALMIEEAQMHGNIMEGALGDLRDIKELKEKRRALKQEVRELKYKKSLLTPSKDSSDDSDD